MAEPTTRTKLTYEDFLELPDDGKRHEIIDGEHYVTPSPLGPGSIRRRTTRRSQVTRDSIEALHCPGRGVQGTPARLCTLTEPNEDMARNEARMQAWFFPDAE